MASSRTTGGDPVEGADPGGTRPTKPSKTTDQPVVSGDRNVHTRSKLDDAAPAKRPEDDTTHRSGK